MTTRAYLCYTHYRVYVRSFSFKLPSFGNLSLIFFSVVARPTRDRRRRGCTCRSAYTRAPTRACDCATCICLRLYARAPSAVRALHAHGCCRRKINIKFTSRLCTHVDRENLVMKFGRGATPRPLIPNRIAIASELDCTRINREYFELEGWEGSYAEYKSAHVENVNPRENLITRAINFEATRDRKLKI